MRFKLVAARYETGSKGNPLDGWIEGPGLPQSAWRYKWLTSCLVLLGIFDRVAMAVYPTYAL